MRKEANALEGVTWVVEHPRELSGVPPGVRRLVSRSARGLFEGYPASLVRLAAIAKRKPLRAALLRMAESNRCELQIHRPGRRGGGAVEVYVQLGAQPVLLTGGIARVPARCPAALGEVLRLIGVVRAEYGFALGLLAPQDQVPLPTLARRYLALYPSERSELRSLLPRYPRSFFAIYENSGAYLCTSRTGQTWSFSLGGGEYGRGPSIGTWLDRFFEAGPFGPTWPIGN